MDHEAVWRGKTDDEIYDAAKQLNDYSEDGKRVIRNEMRRRGMMVAEAATAPGQRKELRSPVLDRYQDAYRVGTTMVGLGITFKIIGLVVAIIIVIAAIAAAKGAFGVRAVFVGVVVAAVNGGLFWICGVIVAALGQILRATLDTAVANSPFMDDAQRLEAMGLSNRAV